MRYEYDYEYDSDEKTTSSEDDDIKEEVVSVEFLPEEKENNDDTYNIEVNSVRIAVIHFFYFIAHGIEYITSFFPKRRFDF